ncbi:MAG: PAS domain-containing protein [Neisseriaceae bacterium]
MKSNGSQDKKFIPDFEDILLDAPGYIFWKDLDSVYRGCNQNGALLYGVTSPDEIIGKTDYDFNQEFADEFVKQDQYVIKTGKLHISESDIITFGNGQTLILRTEKKPLYDKNRKIIGIVGTAVDITTEREAISLKLENANYQAKLKAQESFSDFINAVMNLANSYKIDIFNEKLGINNHHEPLVEIKLSKREEQVLYFLAMGKTPKDIALILSKLEGKSISHETIRSVISKQLYLKLDASNPGQLIEKAMKLHLVPFIPKSLSYFLHKQIEDL